MIPKKFSQMEDPLRFRLSRIKEIEDFFIAEISYRKQMSKTLNKCITALHYAGKASLVLPGVRRGVSLCSFTVVIGAPVGIASASIDLVFLVSSRIVIIFLKSIKREKTLLYWPELN